MHQSEQLVKTQKDELRALQREITPKLVAALYSLLEKKNIPRIATMAETLVALLRNKEEAKSADVELFLRKQEGLIYKMQYAVCHDVKDSVLTKHLETIKVITKHFVDNTTDDYKICSPYAPFLAWASQFIIFCRYQHQLDKIAL